MANKRPSLVGALLEEPTAEVVKINAPSKAVKKTPETHPAAKKDVVRSSIYMPPQVHRKLKEIALAKDCKVHDLIMEGIDSVMKKNGFPSSKELSKK